MRWKSPCGRAREPPAPGGALTMSVVTRPLFLAGSGWALVCQRARPHSFDREGLARRVMGAPR